MRCVLRPGIPFWYRLRAAISSGSDACDDVPLARAWRASHGIAGRQTAPRAYRRPCGPRSGLAQLAERLHRPLDPACTNRLVKKYRRRRTAALGLAIDKSPSKLIVEAGERGINVHAEACEWLIPTNAAILSRGPFPRS